MDAFFATFKIYERTVCVLLSSQLRPDTVYSRVRKFPDAISQAFDASRIPVAVHDTLISETNANLPTLHRYFRLRAKLLGVAQMRYYDIYPPLVRGDYRFPLAKGNQLTLEAVAPLGSDYVQAMAAGVAGRWMNAYPQPRKRSGAHMQGSAYDVHPHMLMNYNDDDQGVVTIDDAYCVEWACIPHFYIGFYVDQYATSIAASSLFADRVAGGERGALERYLNLLKSGGSAIRTGSSRRPASTSRRLRPTARWWRG